MRIGMVGAGRMGANLVRRLMRAGHECVVYDVDAGAVAALEAEGAVGVTTLADLAAALDGPRHVWVMVPAGFVGAVVDDLAALLEPGDTIIDGGNSYYRDDITRAAQLAERGIHYVDCGTSGGVWGLERGYCLMIGGEDDVVARLDPIWATVAPGPGDAEPTPGREPGGTAHRGYLHCGPNELATSSRWSTTASSTG
ncbi:NAD(P)-binding domain-containing protein [Salana multivorans]